MGGPDGGGGKPRCHLLNGLDGPNVGRGRKRTRDSLAAQFDSVAAAASGKDKEGNSKMNGAKTTATATVSDNKENESLATPTSTAAVMLKKNKYGESALHIAVKKGDVGKVRTLIQGRYSVTFHVKYDN